MKLYEIPLRYQKWIDKVEENEGEVSEELAAELLEIEDDLATKADSYAAMIRKFKYEEEAFREESRRMAAKAASAAARQERLKFFLMQAMKSFSVDRICGGRFSISRIVNKTPAITWDSNQAIPKRFQRIQISLDKEGALAAFKSEGSLPEGFKISNTEYVRIS